MPAAGEVKRTRTLIGAAIGVAAAATLVPGAGAERGQSVASVVARVGYARSGDRYRDVRLTIRRDGRIVHRAAIARRPLPLWRPVLPATVRDLDADGEPEVILDVFTGGAHCCTRSHVFRRLQSGRYARTTRNWGNPGYRLRDVDGDGAPELVGGDDRFTYTFAAYVVSAQPVQVWRFSAGRLVDVTRDHPAVVRRDVAQLWQRYRRFRRERVDVRGVLAAWQAGKALLGQAAGGWRTLEAARRRGELGSGRVLFGTPAGRAYLASLRRFLARTGYVR